MTKGGGKNVYFHKTRIPSQRDVATVLPGWQMKKSFSEGSGSILGQGTQEEVGYRWVR